MTLPATDGAMVNLAALVRRTVIYAYPMTGVPGKPQLIAALADLLRQPAEGTA